jgi:hypothetical protein
VSQILCSGNGHRREYLRFQRLKVHVKSTYEATGMMVSTTCIYPVEKFIYFRSCEAQRKISVFFPTIALAALKLVRVLNYSDLCMYV